MTTQDCKWCNIASPSVYVFVPFKNPAHAKPSDPKWAFHIKQLCGTCYRFQKFASQTEELMLELKDNAFIPLAIDQMKQDRIGTITAKLPFEPDEL